MQEECICLQKVIGDGLCWVGAGYWLRIRTLVLVVDRRSVQWRVSFPLVSRSEIVDYDDAMGGELSFRGNPN